MLCIHPSSLSVAVASGHVIITSDSLIKQTKLVEISGHVITGGVFGSTAGLSLLLPPPFKWTDQN